MVLLTLRGGGDYRRCEYQGARIMKAVLFCLPQLPTRKNKFKLYEPTLIVVHLDAYVIKLKIHGRVGP